ncbi:phage tail tape measure protein%2C family%2C core region [Clostridium baratii]|uniref:phage tail tape measure protein n=1 Tax=Clostridium baratii TaxID=1561 RepID=UPI0006C02D2D|nr:phage tail tape measure protein [Clostridium baratii]CUP05831.1 phage tail tape measure protein%2C family%2C core region [Clostridium baratii]
MANGIELAPLVVEVNAKLDNFNNGMDKVEQKGEQTANNATSRLNKIGSGLEKVGGKLTTHVSVPLVAVGTIAAKTGMDFEAEMSRVKAISGATGDQFKMLEDQALSLGQSTAFSASEVAEGMENLASAGFSTNEIMEAMPGLLDLAASSGEDLATSSEIAASTLRGFGLEASKTGHVADVLAKNAAATNAAVADTGEAMKYIAPNARAAGLSLEEVTAAIGELANAGIKGSQAGTTLRSALVRLAKPSDPAATAMERIGFTAFDSSGKMKSLATIMGELNEKTKNLTDEQKQNTIATIFGTEALSGMTVLMQGGKEGLTDLTEQFKNCDGAAKEMAETMQDNTKATIEQAGGALETASIKMLNIVAPAIKDVADGIGNLADKFSALSPETQELILKMGMVAIATGPVLSTVGKGVTLFSKLTPLVTSAGIATAGAGASAGGAAVGFGALSTVALPLVGILSAVAGGIYLFTKNTEVMSSSCLKSKEELGLVGNALEFLHGDIALSTEEMAKMNIKHKEWSDKISPETQKALTETSDKISKLNYELESSNGLDGVISKGQINSLKKRTDELFNETIKKIKSKSPEVQKEMAEAFKADDGTLDKNEKKLMDFFNQSQNKQIKEVKEYQKQINSIYDKAAKEHRDLKQDEIKTIQDLTIKMGQVNLNNTVKNNQELIAAQADFNARMKNLDMNGLSSLLSEKAKARDKEITSIRQNYDKQIEELKLYRPKMNAEQKKACDDQIDKLEKLKTDSVNNEKKKYQGFLDEAMKKYPQLIDYINTSNGEIMSDEEQNSYKRLTRYSETMEGMMGITKSGYYQIKDTVDGSMHDCYVDVDDATGRINGVWDNTTQMIYGNPVKAREAIDQDLKNGQKFQPIVNSYDSKRNDIWKNAIKVQCEQDTGIFAWVRNAWNDSLGYILAHPIKAAKNFFGGGNDGNHYNGLDNVPYDGYIARLHKGERILTAEENARYNSNTDNSIQVTQNIYADTASPYEIAKATKQGLRELQFVGR